MAFVEENYLLTIAIPTYNRSAFLNDALYHIERQVRDKKYSIELIVSDNCSTDDSGLVVNKYINLGLPIRYIKNVENKGADYNIAQCFTLAKGGYVLVFGDDDILLDGAIETIISVINKSPNFGILYLDYCLTSKDIVRISSNIQLFRFDDYEEFLKRVSHSITFISGNIINSKFIKNVNFEKYYNTSLVQLPFYLNAIFNAEYNLVLSKPAVSVPLDNSGGYGICKVFGENINLIFNDMNINDKRNRIFKALNNAFLVTCFPTWIMRLKTSNHNFTKEDIHKSLRPIFKDYLSYWMIDYSLIIQPNTLLKFTWPIFRLYFAVLRRIIPRFKTKKTNYNTIEI